MKGCDQVRTRVRIGGGCLNVDLFFFCLFYDVVNGDWVMGLGGFGGGKAEDLDLRKV